MLDLSRFRPQIDFAMNHALITSLVIAALFALIMLAFIRHRGAILETFFRSYLFWTLTLLFARDAVRYGAFGGETAAVLGPAPFPDLQVAYLSLAFAVIAFLAIAGSFGLRLAAIIGIGVSLLGPFATQLPTPDLVMAHLAEVVVVAIGVLLLLVQSTGVFSRTRYVDSTA